MMSASAAKRALKAFPGQLSPLGLIALGAGITLAGIVLVDHIFHLRLQSPRHDDIIKTNLSANRSPWPTFEEAWNRPGSSRMMQDFTEAKFMVAQLAPEMNVVEFGSGKSTFFLPQFGINLYSIEHYRPWFDKVSAMLHEVPRGNTVKYQFAAINVPAKAHDVWKKPSEYATYKDYIRAARSWVADGIYFDLAFVDGRARPQVAIEALFLADPTKLDKLRILVHDVVTKGRQNGIRDHYLIIEHFYDRVSQVATMTLWKPKPNAIELVINYNEWPEWWCAKNVKPDARCSQL